MVSATEQTQTEPSTPYPLPTPLRDAQILAAKRGEVDWRSLVIDPEDDLISLPSTAPGRPRTFLTQPEIGTSPFSCEMIQYDNRLYEGLLKPMSRFLRCGAGVKVNLDKLETRKPANPQFDWHFVLDPLHPDFDKLDSQQRQYLNFNFQDENTIVLKVQDSMESPENQEISGSISSPFFISSIEGSWQAMINSAAAGQKIIFDLSQLRPYGTVNKNGLMASGPIGLGKQEKEEGACSFFSILKVLADYLKDPSVQNLLILMGTVNDTLRRGGFKRGIVTTAMSWSNRAIDEYLDVPLSILPGGHKKGFRYDEQQLLDLLRKNDKNAIALTEKVIEKRNSESLFIAKIIPNFFDNVCMGLGIPDYGTCLIWRFNAGKIDSMCDIPKWMVRVASQLSLLHLNWRNERPEIAKLVAPLEKDLQIGLDIMGMANLLASFDITYAQMNEALKNYLANPDRYADSILEDDLVSEADRLVYWLALGYKESTKECDRICDLYQVPRFERIHTASEPAQSHSYETTDVLGYTTCRAIYPAVGKSTRKGVKVRRVSSHQKNVMVNHGFVETIAEVGPTQVQDFCANYNAFVGLVGRSHQYFSLDTYQEMTMKNFVEFSKDSRLHSLYYAEHKNFEQQYLAKSAPSLRVLQSDRNNECAVCAE